MLNHSLKKHRSKYPLIVAVNPQLPAETVDALQQAGLDIRVVQNLAPKGKVTLIAERFADTWTKCAVFDFVEYDVSFAIRHRTELAATGLDRWGYDVTTKHGRIVQYTTTA